MPAHGLLANLQLVLAALGAALICFLSLAETALLSVTSATAERALAEKKPGAHTLKRLVTAEVDYLSTIMVTCNLLLLAVSLLVTHYLISSGLQRHLTWISALVIVGILTFAEITPKTIGLHRAAYLAPIVAPPVAWLTRTMSWLVSLLTRTANAFCRLLRIKPIHRRHFVTEDDIKFFALLGGQEGLIEEAEREMIEGIMELPETTAAEIKIPRTDMVALDLTAPLSDAARLVAETGHSRIPVYRENLDDILGVLHAKDLLRALAAQRRPASLQDLLRPPLLAPESKRVDQLLREMRQKKTSIAIVLDEYGGVDGLVTVEDILEQIVGPVHDEHDAPTQDIVRLSPTMAIIDPKLHLDRLEDELGLRLPQGDYSTLAGFLLEKLGHMPEPGERLNYRNCTFLVEGVEAQRITRVRLAWRAKPGQEPSAPPAGSDTTPNP